MMTDDKAAATLYGLGLGPGDPELMTLKAHRILREVPVIAYPAPDSGDSFARHIAAPYLPGGQTEVPIVIPMRVERFPARNVYDRVSAELSGHLDAGRDVAVLCEGDPFFYGSFMYLFERMTGNHPCVVVPGVTSMTACAAAVARPLAARNDALAVIPAPLPDDQIIARLERAEAIVIIKVGRHFNRIKHLLTRLALVENAAWCERVSLDQERVAPLSAVAFDETGGIAPYFSMIIVYRGEEPAIRTIGSPHGAFLKPAKGSDDG